MNSVNETWISDRDRFSYEGLNHESRALKPKIKIDGQWQESGWQEALQFAVDGIKNNAKKPDQLRCFGIKKFIIGRVLPDAKISAPVWLGKYRL